MLARRLRDMNNMMNAKEEKLRGRHRDTHAAIQWLRQNRNMFTGNVYEPVMLVVSHICTVSMEKHDVCNARVAILDI